jgi:hypothetical protein
MTNKTKEEIITIVAEKIVEATIHWGTKPE